MTKIRIISIALCLIGFAISASLTFLFGFSEKRANEWLVAELSVMWFVKIFTYGYMAHEMQKRTTQRTPLGMSLIDMFTALAFISAILGLGSTSGWLYSRGYWSPVGSVNVILRSVLVGGVAVTVFTNIVAIDELFKADKE